MLNCIIGDLYQAHLGDQKKLLFMEYFKESLIKQRGKGKISQNLCDVYNGCPHTKIFELNWIKRKKEIRNKKKEENEGKKLKNLKIKFVKNWWKS